MPMSMAAGRGQPHHLVDPAEAADRDHQGQQPPAGAAHRQTPSASAQARRGETAMAIAATQPRGERPAGTVAR